MRSPFSSRVTQEFLVCDSSVSLFAYTPGWNLESLAYPCSSHHTCLRVSSHISTFLLLKTPAILPPCFARKPFAGLPRKPAHTPPCWHYLVQITTIPWFVTSDWLKHLQTSKLAVQNLNHSSSPSTSFLVNQFVLEKSGWDRREKDSETYSYSSHILQFFGLHDPFAFLWRF